MKNYIICSCCQCKQEIIVQQLSRHFGSKQCKLGKKNTGKPSTSVPEDLSCRYCRKCLKNKNSFINHERTCPQNPQRKYKNGFAGKTSPTKGTTKFNNDIVQKRTETRNARIASGEIDTSVFRRNHTEETKDKLSQLACERISKHSKYTKNVEYQPGIILESSYEVRVAEILDSLGIEWIKVRRGYIWDDNGKRRRYIPDFYLPKQDIFLDPKNDYLIKKDKRKIESAMKLNNIKVVILSDDMINEELIKSLVL